MQIFQRAAQVEFLYKEKTFCHSKYFFTLGSLKHTCYDPIIKVRVKVRVMNSKV